MATPAGSSVTAAPPSVDVEQLLATGDVASVVHAIGKSAAAKQTALHSLKQTSAGPSGRSNNNIALSIDDVNIECDAPVPRNMAEARAWLADSLPLPLATVASLRQQEQVFVKLHAQYQLQLKPVATVTIPYQMFEPEVADTKHLALGACALLHRMGWQEVPPAAHQHLAALLQQVPAGGLYNNWATHRGTATQVAAAKSCMQASEPLQAASAFFAALSRDSSDALEALLALAAATAANWSLFDVCTALASIGEPAGMAKSQQHVTSYMSTVMTQSCLRLLKPCASNLPAGSFTCSSFVGPDTAGSARFARLNCEDGRGGWIPHELDTSPWLSIDLGTVQHIGGFQTQGAASVPVVSSFSVMVSSDATSWKPVRSAVSGSATFVGNSNSSTVATHVIQPVDARFIRFRLDDARGGLRVEVLVTRPRVEPSFTHKFPGHLHALEPLSGVPESKSDVPSSKDATRAATSPWSAVVFLIDHAIELLPEQSTWASPFSWDLSPVTVGAIARLLRTIQSQCCAQWPRPHVQHAVSCIAHMVNEIVRVWQTVDAHIADSVRECMTESAELLFHALQDASSALQVSEDTQTLLSACAVGVMLVLLPAARNVAILRSCLAQSSAANTRLIAALSNRAALCADLFTLLFVPPTDTSADLATDMLAQALRDVKPDSLTDSHIRTVLALQSAVIFSCADTPQLRSVVVGHAQAVLDRLRAPDVPPAPIALLVIAAALEMQCAAVVTNTVDIGPVLLPVLVALAAQSASLLAAADPSQGAAVEQANQMVAYAATLHRMACAVDRESGTASGLSLAANLCADEFVGPHSRLWNCVACCVWAAARVAVSVSQGTPIDATEAAVEPWVMSCLFSTAGAPAPAPARSWEAAWTEVQTKSNNAASPQPSGQQPAVSLQSPVADADVHQPAIQRLLSGGAVALIDWLAIHAPLTGLAAKTLSKRRSFEPTIVTAMLKHAGLLLDAIEVLDQLHSGASPVDVLPSDDLLHVWLGVKSMRQWLHDQRAAATIAGATSPEAKNGDDAEQDTKEDSVKQALAAAAGRALARAEYLLQLPATTRAFRRLADKSTPRDGSGEAMPPTAPPLLRRASSEGATQLSSKWANQLPPTALAAFNTRWQHLGDEHSDRWGAIASVLKAQAQLTRARSVGEVPDGLPEGPETVAEAVCRAVCVLCIQNVNLDISMVGSIAARRAQRADDRAFALRGLAQLFSAVAPAFLQRLILVQLPAAFETKSLHPRANNAQQPLHYFAALAGVGDARLDAVQVAFLCVYTQLASLLNTGADAITAVLVLWNLCLDYQSRDHEVLLRMGVADATRRLAGIAGFSEQVIQLLKNVDCSRGMVTENIIVGREFWKQAIAMGIFTRREALLHRFVASSDDANVSFISELRKHPNAAAITQLVEGAWPSRAAPTDAESADGALDPVPQTLVKLASAKLIWKAAQVACIGLLYSCVGHESPHALFRKRLMEQAAVDGIVHSSQGVGGAVNAGQLSLSSTAQFTLGLQRAVFGVLEDDAAVCCQSVADVGSCTSVLDYGESISMLRNMLQAIALLPHSTAVVRQHLSKPSLLGALFQLAGSMEPHTHNLLMSCIGPILAALPRDVAESAIRPHESWTLCEYLLDLVARGVATPRGCVVPRNMWGAGSLIIGRAMEGINMLRLLLHSEQWQSEVVPQLLHAIQQAEQAPERAAAALAVLCSRAGSVRVGGRVRAFIGEVEVLATVVTYNPATNCAVLRPSNADTVVKMGIHRLQPVEDVAVNAARLPSAVLENLVPAILSAVSATTPVGETDRPLFVDMFALQALRTLADATDISRLVSMEAAAKILTWASQPTCGDATQDEPEFWAARNHICGRILDGTTTTPPTEAAGVATAGAAAGGASGAAKSAASGDGGRGSSGRGRGRGRGVRGAKAASAGPQRVVPGDPSTYRTSEASVAQPNGAAAAASTAVAAASAPSPAPVVTPPPPSRDLSFFGALSTSAQITVASASTRDIELQQSTDFETLSRFNWTCDCAQTSGWRAEPRENVARRVVTAKWSAVSRSASVYVSAIRSEASADSTPIAKLLEGKAWRSTVEEPTIEFEFYDQMLLSGLKLVPLEPSNGWSTVKYAVDGSSTFQSIRIRNDDNNQGCMFQSPIAARSLVIQLCDRSKTAGNASAPCGLSELRILTQLAPEALELIGWSGGTEIWWVDPSTGRSCSKSVKDAKLSLHTKALGMEWRKELPSRLDVSLASLAARRVLESLQSAAVAGESHAVLFESLNAPQLLEYLRRIAAGPLCHGTLQELCRGDSVRSGQLDVLYQLVAGLLRRYRDCGNTEGAAALFAALVSEAAAQAQQYPAYASIRFSLSQSSQQATVIDLGLKQAVRVLVASSPSFVDMTLNLIDDTPVGPLDGTPSRTSVPASSIPAEGYVARLYRAQLLRICAEATGSRSREAVPWSVSGWVLPSQREHWRKESLSSDKPSLRWVVWLVRAIVRLADDKLVPAGASTSSLLSALEALMANQVIINPWEFVILLAELCVRAMHGTLTSRPSSALLDRLSQQVSESYGTSTASSTTMKSDEYMWAMFSAMSYHLARAHYDQGVAAQALAEGRMPSALPLVWTPNAAFTSTPCDAAGQARCPLHPSFQPMKSGSSDRSSEPAWMELWHLGRLIADGTRLPDSYVSELWWNAIGCVTTVSHEHLGAGATVEAEASFAGASSVFAWVSDKSVLAGGSLMLQTATSRMITESQFMTCGQTPVHGSTVRYRVSVGSDVKEGELVAGLQMALVWDSVTPKHRLIAMSKSRAAIEQAILELSSWTAEMDAELLRWLVQVSKSWSSPLQDMSAGVLYVASLQGFPLLSTCSRGAIAMRYFALKRFNAAFAGLGLFEVSNSPSPIVQSLHKSRGRLFGTVRRDLFDIAVRASRFTTGSPPEFEFSNMLATQSDQQGWRSVHRSRCMFAQLFDKLATTAHSVFRRQLDHKQRIFLARLANESGIDWGGVSRDIISQSVEDLGSDRFDLFIPCPNAQLRHHDATDAVIPNPAYAVDGRALDMYQFVGQLVGLSMRLDLCFPFRFAPCVWKVMAGGALEEADIVAIDGLLLQALTAIRRCEEQGVTDETSFSAAFPSLTFVSSGFAGGEVELCPGGRDIPVTWKNRLQYCEQVVAMRINEVSEQVAAMRRGLYQVVPRCSMALFDPLTMETLAVGTPTISVAVLRAHVQYHDQYSERHPNIQRFWRVLDSMTDAERSGLVRFTWGRSRLPEKHWDTSFNIHGLHHGRLPIGHTCFFQIDLPEYETDEAMRHALITASTFGVGGVLTA